MWILWKAVLLFFFENKKLRCTFVSWFLIYIFWILFFILFIFCPFLHPLNFVDEFLFCHEIVSLEKKMNRFYKFKFCTYRHLHFAMQVIELYIILSTWYFQHGIISSTALSVYHAITPLIKKKNDTFFHWKFIYIVNNTSSFVLTDPRVFKISSHVWIKWQKNSTIYIYKLIYI